MRKKRGRVFQVEDAASVKLQTEERDWNIPTCVSGGERVRGGDPPGGKACLVCAKPQKALGPLVGLDYLLRAVRSHGRILPGE